MTSLLKIGLGLCATTIAAATIVACSSGGSGSGQAPLPEHTGSASLKLTSIPSDVRCVEIDTSDYRTNYVAVDVTPGSSATINIGPLDTGTVWFYGQAYSTPCNNRYSFDGGPSTVTWVADSTPVTIYAGQDSQAFLNFHQLGSANITVNFDNCAEDSGVCVRDAGPGFDAGPIFFVDGG